MTHQDRPGAPTADTAAHPAPRTGRRQVVLGAGLLAVGASTALAGCGSGGSTGNAGSGAAVGPGGTASVPTRQVPVGGGTILTDPPVVITQPTAGTFKAFSAICPHAGCPVNTIQDGVIQCPCHLSQFDISTGDVKSGPAPRGLTPLTAAVHGGTITVS